MPIGRIHILNWNIAGAKYLELKSLNSPKFQTGGKPSREDFRGRLNKVLQELIDTYSPDVITLQEVVRYSPEGDPDQGLDVIDVPKGYLYYTEWLIDTKHHSATGKWDSVRDEGEWPETAFFAQGNAILVKDSIGCFRIFDLPAPGQRLEPNHDSKTESAAASTPVRTSLPVEVVKLESGLYLGDRNTEPRAGIVTHLVLESLRPDSGKQEERLAKPLDVFVVNLHLTTLLMEREGVPGVDEEASQTRLRQLDIVLNGIISRYNTWRKEGYRWRKESKKTGDAKARPRHTDRYSPIWIVAGDFNFTRESVEYLSMVRRGFIDMIANHGLGTKTQGIGQLPTLTVDYVFAGPRFEAIDPRLAEEAAHGNSVAVNPRTRISDHFPVIVSVPIQLPSN